jgi:hypothetical protein
MSKSMKEFGKDKSSPMNLPQEAHRSEFPKRSSVNSEYDDSITGIDEVISRGIGKVKKHPSHQK